MNLIVDIRDPKYIQTDLHHVWFIFKYLVENYGYEIINIKKNDNFTKRIKLFQRKNKKSKLKNIIIFSHLKYLNFVLDIKDVNIIWYGDDLHKPNSINILNKISKYILSYGYAFNKYQPSIQDNIYFFPHSASYEIEFNENPIEKVLVSGRYKKGFYPKRKIAIDLVEKGKLDCVEYFCPDFLYLIPQKEYKETDVCSSEFVKKLNEYLVCFTCDMSEKTPYILAKVFEIMSAGSLLLYAIEDENKKYFEKLGFIDGRHYISCKSDNIEKMMKLCLSDDLRDNIDQIRYRAYKYVRKYHTYINRAEALNKIVMGEDNFKKFDDGIDGTNYSLAI
jgi:hypothetical protein